jgi:DNA-directed RNA polymerase specialized sigma24 family protein
VTPEARAEIQALLGRLCDGDRSAIEPAFRAIWPMLERFSARALGGAAEAEDAAQQAIVKVYGQVARFDRERDGVAWVLAIASYECRTLRRRTGRRKEQSLDPAHALATDDGTPEALAVQRDLEAAAREVLGAMRGDDVDAILAAIDETRPAGDATFRKRLQRALGRFRLAWRTKHGT